MQTRREFIKTTGTLAIGAMILPSFMRALENITDPGVQLYSFRKEMLADPVDTLKKIAKLGIKQIESASSDKGHYYGLQPKEMKDICASLGLTLRSGHVHVDQQWETTLAEAIAAGQEYLICSSLPQDGQTARNYESIAKQFNEVGAACKKANIKFGYHNHDFEFEKEKGKVLYDILLEQTDPSLVHMELDLGWVVATGNNPIDYFKQFPGRFPLWHLKDMNLKTKQSTEFGKGGLDIKAIWNTREASGLKYFFIEQEEYTLNAFQSMKENMEYLKRMG